MRFSSCEHTPPISSCIRFRDCQGFPLKKKKEIAYNLLYRTPIKLQFAKGIPQGAIAARCDLLHQLVGHLGINLQQVEMVLAAVHVSLYLEIAAAVQQTSVLLLDRDQTSEDRSQLSLQLQQSLGECSGLTINGPRINISE